MNLLLLFLPLSWAFTHHQILRDSSLNQPFFNLSPSQLSNSIEGSVSNFPPVLQVSSAVGYLDENAEIGTTVRISPHLHSESLQIIVSDADLKAGMPPATYQYVLTGLGATVFAVDQRGFVYLNVNSIDSDPPNPQTYQLTVQAREVDTVPIRSSAPVTITIHIVDANDNSPQFENPILTAETAARGGMRSIVKVEATDKDDGLFGSITYAITQVDGGADTHLFFYDQPTHTLMTKEDLEPGRSYQVVVTATDGGGLTAQSIIIVVVLPDTVVETSTSISLSSHQSTDEETIQTIVTDLPHSSSPNSLVVQLGDDRPLYDLHYSIEGGNEEGKFTIDPSTGAIRTVGSFDSQSSSLFSLQIETRSRENNQHLYWTLVQISITRPPNKNAPLFVGTQPLRVSLSIDHLSQLEGNTKVGEIGVRDEDEGENGQIEMGVLSPHDRLFTIDSHGTIRINGEFTAEHLGEHRIMVFARDGGSPPKESLASIIVNINTSSNIEIVTEVPTQTFSFFTFPPESTTQSYTIPTSSQESSYETSTEAERLAPVFSPPSIAVAIEENKADIQIATVSAAYPDGNGGPVTYILMEGDPTTFKVDSYTGAVRLIRPLDAESENSLSLIVSTAESSSLLINPVLAHNVTVTVVIGDANDWIPAFEHSQYSFSVRSDTQPGSIIGQTTAFDEDRDAPNNAIIYSIVGGGDGLFSINGQNGLITLARPLNGMAGQKISLRVEARDGGEPSQSTTSAVLITVEENDKMITIIDDGKEAEKGAFIRFKHKNFSSSISESLRPPHLVSVLQVESSIQSPFITCSILTGNFKGAFSVTPNGGNCELRTQMELDREEIERHILNISVSSSTGLSDWSIVHVTVLDSNDNTPIFQFDNDFSLMHYYAGVSSEASAFTRVLTVKATDADIGNSSMVRYSLDALSLHSKYFSISPQGEISTRQSMSQLLHSTKIDKFDLKILACDTPSIGSPLCSRAPATIVVVKDENRIRMATSGMKPAQLTPHHVDIIRSLRSHSGRCSLFLLDRMVELPPSIDGKTRSNLTWIALDPIARTLCGKEELKPLFEPTSLVVTQGKLRPWFSVESISSEADVQKRESSLSSLEWKASSAILILVSVFIALGALIATCSVCYFWTRYKRSQNHNLPHPYPAHAYPPTKLGTIFLPNPSMNMNMDNKMYETQMLEMPISEEDLTLKGRQQSGSSGESRERERVSYRSYGRDLKNYEQGDLALEETMYAPNASTRYDIHSKSFQSVIIPSPDYRY